MPISPTGAYYQTRGLLRRQKARLASLYEVAVKAQQDAEAVGKSLTRPLTGRTENRGNVVMGERMLDIDDLSEAAEVRNIYAGTVLDVMHSALSPLIESAEEHGLRIYRDLEPKVQDIPVWKLIDAGRNNHHHWTDWCYGGKPNKTQLHDIRALCMLLFGYFPPEPLQQSPITCDVSLEVLRKLSNSYAELDILVRKAAYDIVNRLGYADDNQVVFAIQENGGLP